MENRDDFVASYSWSVSSPIQSIPTGFGLQGLLASRVAAKNARDLAIAQSLTSPKQTITSGGGGVGGGGFHIPFPSGSDLDRFDEGMRKDIERLEAKDKYKVFPEDSGADARGRAIHDNNQRKALEKTGGRKQEPWETVYS